MGTAGGNVNSVATVEKSMAVPQKSKQLPYDLAIPFLDKHPKELKEGPRRVIRTPMFIATLSTIVKKQK